MGSTHGRKTGSTPVLTALALTALLAACADAIPTASTPSDPGSPQTLLADRRAASCMNVSGTITGNVLPPPGEDYPIPSLVTGDLQGFVTAYAEPQDEQKGRGSIHLATFHLFLLDDGIILTEDKGVMAPKAPPYFRLNNRYGIIGGEGMWEGASGFLQVQGDLVIDYDLWYGNPENGNIDATYHGRICRPAGF